MQGSVKSDLGNQNDQKLLVGRAMLSWRNAQEAVMSLLGPPSRVARSFRPFEDLDQTCRCRAAASPEPRLVPARSFGRIKWVGHITHTLLR